MRSPDRRACQPSAVASGSRLADKAADADPPAVQRADPQRGPAGSVEPGAGLWPAVPRRPGSPPRALGD
jgi:hypothetical protein